MIQVNRCIGVACKYSRKYGKELYNCPRASLELKVCMLEAEYSRRCCMDVGSKYPVPTNTASYALNVTTSCGTVTAFGRKGLVQRAVTLGCPRQSYKREILETSIRKPAFLFEGLLVHLDGNQLSRCVLLRLARYTFSSLMSMRACGYTYDFFVYAWDA